jgi:hypothetical protein
MLNTLVTRRGSLVCTTSPFLTRQTSPLAGLFAMHGSFQNRVWSLTDSTLAKLKVVWFFRKLHYTNSLISYNHLTHLLILNVCLGKKIGLAGYHCPHTCYVGLPAFPKWEGLFCCFLIIKTTH